MFVLLTIAILLLTAGILVADGFVDVERICPAELRDALALMGVATPVVVHVRSLMPDQFRDVGSGQMIGCRLPVFGVDRGGQPCTLDDGFRAREA